jgi:hypothetical protein
MILVIDQKVWSIWRIEMNRRKVGLYSCFSLVGFVSISFRITDLDPCWSVCGGSPLAWSYTVARVRHRGFQRCAMDAVAFPWPPVPSTDLRGPKCPHCRGRGIDAGAARSHCGCRRLRWSRDARPTRSACIAEAGRDATEPPRPRAVVPPEPAHACRGRSGLRATGAPPGATAPRGGAPGPGPWPPRHRVPPGLGPRQAERPRAAQGSHAFAEPLGPRRVTDLTRAVAPWPRPSHGRGCAPTAAGQPHPRRMPWLRARPPASWPLPPEPRPGCARARVARHRAEAAPGRG